MKKQLFFLAVAALALASCSSENVSQEKSALQNAEPGTVIFDSYVTRGITRAGQPGLMNLDNLKNPDAGFGVFAYYTDNTEYDQLSLPNFMYNQKVTHNGSVWNYSPVKYWPNEFGSSAISDDQDKVSFFAYAPYVDVTPSTGKLTSNAKDYTSTTGIMGLSRNTANGDPLVKYVGSFSARPAEFVDLCWGVCDDPQWSIILDGSMQHLTKGLPWLNVQRPRGIDQKLKFNFKHALTQLNVQVDAYVDGTDNSIPLGTQANGNKDDDGTTKIYIRSISFTGIAQKGALNLNNSSPNKALWMDYNGGNDLESGEEVTIYDGRKDGKEGTIGAVAATEKILGLNPDVISDDRNTNEGVTNVPKNVFNSTTVDDPIYVIPTGEKVQVTIVYDIETADDNLPAYVSDGITHGSSIENRITKAVSFGDANSFENGKKYTLKLHLGLNSVKFDAEVSDWVDASAAPDVDLPSNLTTMHADVDSNTPHNDVDVDWNYATSGAETKYYIYAVDGFNGGEAVTKQTETGCSVVINSKPDFNGTANQANASGVAYVKVQITDPNDDVVNNATPVVAKVKGGVSNKEHTLNITQLARPLGMSVNSVTTTTIVLEKANSGGWQEPGTGTGGTPAASITILKNGVTMDSDDTPTAGKYKFDGSTGTITFGTSLVPGDIYTITVKTGDTAEETVVAKIGGITYGLANSRTLTYKTTAQDAYLPNYYGPGTPTYTWSETGTGNIVSVDDSGKVTTNKAGTTAKITATLSNPTATEAKAQGWYFISTTAEYSLTVNKQAATIGFIHASISASTSAGTAIDASQEAILKDAAKNTLTPDNGGDKLVNEAAITYVVDNANFEIDATYKVKPKTGIAADTYTVTVTATVTDGLAYAYAVKTATYTMTVTVTD